MKQMYPKGDALYARAFHFVRKHFKDRKDLGGNPYIGHLLRVSRNELLFTAKMRVVGLLHDVLEDIDNISVGDLLELFPPDIVNEVCILTKKSGQDYSDYIHEVGQSEIATRVKLADLEDNMDLSRLPKVTNRALDRLEKYKKSHAYLTKKLSIFEMK